MGKVKNGLSMENKAAITEAAIQNLLLSYCYCRVREGSDF